MVLKCLKKRHFIDFSATGAEMGITGAGAVN
jgi:hypothetical protein